MLLTPAVTPLTLRPIVFIPDSNISLKELWDELLLKREPMELLEFLFIFMVTAVKLNFRYQVSQVEL